MGGYGDGAYGAGPYGGDVVTRDRAIKVTIWRGGGGTTPSGPLLDEGDGVITDEGGDALS